MDNIAEDVLIEFVHNNVRPPLYVIRNESGNKTSMLEVEIWKPDMSNDLKANILENTIDLLHREVSEERREKITWELLEVSRSTLKHSKKIVTVLFTKKEAERSYQLLISDPKEPIRMNFSTIQELNTYEPEFKKSIEKISRNNV